MKTLRLTNTNGNVFVLGNIDEYVCGFSFFYVRYADGNTQSVARNSIGTVERLTANNIFRPIHLKKPVK